MVEAAIETTQYLTFNLADEIFAVNVGRVREILELPLITRIPRAPDFVRGVINVRGSVVPVVDLRTRFDVPGREDSIETCIVVLEIKLDGDTVVVGAVADAVREVLDFGPGEIEPAPRVGSLVDTEFIAGIGNHDGQFVIILDIDRLLLTEDLAAVHATGDGNQQADADVRNILPGTGHGSQKGW